MASRSTTIYNAAEYGPKEVEMQRQFYLQLDDARNYFKTCIKPRLDRAYKLYIAYNGDRQKQIFKWQANIFVPYAQAVVETLMPRILDARPDFTIQGRNEDDQMKALKLQKLADYSWEKAGMDETSETLVRSSMIYGTGFLQASWKKDVRTHKFLVTQDLAKKKYDWKEKKQVFYDAPYAEWVDNYGLWYDWHNVPRASKQYWFKRLILSKEEITRKYPMADKERLAMAFEYSGGDLVDYGSIRNEVKTTHDGVYKGADANPQASGLSSSIYQTNVRMHEVFEWWRPFEDAYAVEVNNVPILKGGVMPNPYNFKEAPFIGVPYLQLPNEFEGVGLPLILENQSVMLNMIKNQRLDAMTLSIHKMWIVNPLANIDKKELVTRPFGIIYSTDPQGVREVQFSDIKSSAYKEEDLLKNDMRYASGVDDFSMGVGGGAGSATEVRHLRESTLERVRLFINHLGTGYSVLMRYWMSMFSQFFTKDMTIRVIGEDGKEDFPLIQKDDLMGEYDFKAAVIPSIAGKNDIDKKQSMDLFQLLSPMPFIDMQKLTSKVLHSWNWSLDSLMKSEAPILPETSSTENSDVMAGSMPGAHFMGDSPTEEPGPVVPGLKNAGGIPDSVIQQAMALFGKSAPAAGAPMGEASAPINLLKAGTLPPTAAKIPTSTTNPRGLNRGGKVNTNASNTTSSAESRLLSRASSTQKGQ